MKEQRIIWLVRCWIINIFSKLFNARIFSPSRFDPDIQVFEYKYKYTFRGMELDPDDEVDAYCDNESAW